MLPEKKPVLAEMLHDAVAGWNRSKDVLEFELLTELARENVAIPRDAIALIEASLKAVVAKAMRDWMADEQGSEWNSIFAWELPVYSPLERCSELLAWARSQGIEHPAGFFDDSLSDSAKRFTRR